MTEPNDSPQATPVLVSAPSISATVWAVKLIGQSLALIALVVFFGLFGRCEHWGVSCVGYYAEGGAGGLQPHNPETGRTP